MVTSSTCFAVTIDSELFSVQACFSWSTERLITVRRIRIKSHLYSFLGKSSLLVLHLHTVNPYLMISCPQWIMPCFSGCSGQPIATNCYRSSSGRSGRRQCSTHSATFSDKSRLPRQLAHQNRIKSWQKNFAWQWQPRAKMVVERWLMDLMAVGFFVTTFNARKYQHSVRNLLGSIFIHINEQKEIRVSPFVAQWRVFDCHQPLVNC